MIRPATPADVPRIGQFIRELAAYEKAPEQAVATDAQLHTALFGPDPAVYAHLACDDVSGEPVGFAMWFLNFSTWRGRHGIYLEDLYVRPQARGHGHGKALLAELARLAVERGLWCVQWWVLDWNRPSIDFYESLGAVAQDEWTVYRISDAPLARLAAAAESTAAVSASESSTA
ncbi:GNAT family N-acetyltransferase [Allorhizocola rhizosphaerae]|uniref:GNAT family N-acetyltransferase n=1 Tax=Allorhizocola rhizosphaerae TaxID=1872709 RepID=UPI000E3E64E0|nr:GNAT family N-acetyltransferase [Allorhizocola rhizosphaerae]